jgi:hypothetical protein
MNTVPGGDFRKYRAAYANEKSRRDRTPGEVFDHVGLLFNEPSSDAEMLFV